jgi:hypothetical protein
MNIVMKLSLRKKFDKNKITIIEEPPKFCPKCKSELNIKERYRCRDNKIAAVAKFLGVISVPIMFFVFLHQRISGNISMGFGLGYGYIFLTYILAPCIFFYWIAHFFHKLLDVRCDKCGWRKIYPCNKR